MYEGLGIEGWSLTLKIALKPDSFKTNVLDVF